MIVGIVDGSLIKDGSAVSCVIIKNTKTNGAKKINDLIEKYSLQIEILSSENYQGIQGTPLKDSLSEIYKKLEEVETEVFIKAKKEINNSTDIEKSAIIEGIEIIKGKMNSLEAASLVVSEILEGEKDYIIYSDCANSFNKKFNNKIKNVKWIRGHIGNPIQELADLAAKLGAITNKDFTLEGKVKEINNLLIKYLNEENKKLKNRKETEKKKENKELKNRKVLTLKEKDQRGLFKIYYEENLAYELYANNIRDVFEFCVGNKKELDIQVKNITDYFKKNPRPLREGDAIKDCREIKCWINFKLDPITNIVIPRYSFKLEELENENENKDNIKENIKLAHIKSKEFCLYALKSLEYKDKTTISSNIIRRTQELTKEEEIDQVICVGTLINCIQNSQDRKKYTQIRKDIKSKQTQLNRLKKLQEKLEEKDLLKVDLIFSTIYNKKIGNSKEWTKNIKYCLQQEISRIIMERNIKLAESIKNLKVNSSFFLEK